MREDNGLSQDDPTVPSSPWEAIRATPAPSRQRRGPSAPAPQAAAPIAAPQAQIALPSPYEYISELGRGGMGVVYLARDPRNDSQVALKFLNATGQEAASLSKRFSREANQLAALGHPNIVGFLEAGYFQKQNYIAMEYVEGGSLRSYLQEHEGPMTVQASLELFAGVADGLDYIHSQGLIHRDLKPDNILLTPERVPKIGDFGLALKLEDQASRITKSGMILGTFSYLSPEQILSRDVGPSTDLYALGCCLYEAVTGQPLFSADTEFALLNSHLRQQPTPACQVRVDIPPELDSLIMRLLAKQPGERPESAAEVARSLRRLQQTQVQVWNMPLIGRDELLEDLENRIRPCLLRQSIAVMLTAPSGQGRSRVVRQLIGQLQRASIPTHTLVPLPYQQEPAAELFRQLGGDPEQWTQTFHQFGAEGAAKLLWKQVEQLGAPRVLVIDDLLRQPGATNAVVEALCRQAPNPGFGWLLSCATHRANTLKVWDGALRVELKPLEDGPLREVAHLQLNGHLDDELSEGLLFRAAGSVRRMRLLILALRGSAMLRRNGQLVTRDHEQPWPENMWEPLWRQLSARPEAEVKLLRIACLLDEPFPYELVVSLAELEESESQTALDMLLRDGLLEECWGRTGELFQFSSRELKDKLQASCPDRLRRRVYSRVTQVLEGRAPTGVVAEYLSRAGNEEEAMPKFLQAAFEADQAGDTSQAERFWNSAVRLCGSEGAPEIRLMALIGRTDSLLRLGRYPEVEEAAREELARPYPESSELKRSRRQLAGNCARARWQLGQRGPEVIQFCRNELGQLADSEFSDSLWLTWCWAAQLREQGQPAEALDVLAKLAEQAAYPAPYYGLKANLLRSLGQLVTAQALLRSYLDASNGRSPQDDIEILLEAAVLQAQLKQSAETYLNQASNLAQQLGEPDRLCHIEWLRGLTHEAQHDMGAALRCYQRVIEQARPDGRWLSQGYLQHGIALTKMERLEEAQRVLEEGLNAPPRDAYGLLYVALGVVLVLRGDHNAAREAFVCAEQNQVGPIARIGRSWCLGQAGEREVAQRLLESVDAPKDPLDQWLHQRLDSQLKQGKDSGDAPEETPWVLQGHPARAAISRLGQHKAATVPNTAPAQRPQPQPEKVPHQPSSTNWALVGFAGLTLLSLAGLGFVLWNRFRPAPVASASPTPTAVITASSPPVQSATPTTFSTPVPVPIKLQVSPKFATVKINGRKVEVDKQTGLVDTQIEPGQVYVDVSADGYESDERSLSVTDSREELVKISLTLSPVELVVKATPAPARVYLDGKEVGRSEQDHALELQLKKLGEHKVKVVRDGYISQTKKITARAGKNLVLDFSLRPEPVYVAPAPAPAPVSQPYYPPAPAPAPYYPPAPAPAPASGPDSF